MSKKRTQKDTKREHHFAVLLTDVKKALAPLREMGIKMRFSRIENIWVYRIEIESETLPWFDAKIIVMQTIQREFGRYAMHFLV